MRGDEISISSSAGCDLCVPTARTCGAEGQYREPGDARKSDEEEGGGDSNLACKQGGTQNSQTNSHTHTSELTRTPACLKALNRRPDRWLCRLVQEAEAGSSICCFRCVCARSCLCACFSSNNPDCMRTRRTTGRRGVGRRVKEEGGKNLIPNMRLNLTWTT